MVKYILFSQMPTSNRRRLGSKLGKQKSAQAQANKPEWNSYLTPDGQYALSKDEILRRKQLTISKHNILHSDSVHSSSILKSADLASSSSSDRASSSYLTPKKFLESSRDDSHVSTGERSSVSQNVTALDLLSPQTPSVSRSSPIALSSYPNLHTVPI